MYTPSVHHLRGRPPAPAAARRTTQQHMNGLVVKAGWGAANLGEVNGGSHNVAVAGINAHHLAMK